MTTAIRPAEQLGLGIPEAERNITTGNAQHSSIHPDPLQPREEADDDLRETIRVQGLLQPIAVRSVLPGEGACPDCGKTWAEISEEGGYIIVFGERRWRGAKGVMKMIPVMVREDFQDPALRLIAQAAENAHKALTPLEEAKQYQRILDTNPKMTVTQLAASVVGKAASTVKDRLALLRNKAWLPLLEAGEITTSQAVEVARYADRSERDQDVAIRRMRGWANDVDAFSRLSAREVAWFREQIEHAYATEAPKADAAQESLLPDDEPVGEHPVPGARTVGRVAPPRPREEPEVPAESPAPSTVTRIDGRPSVPGPDGLIHGDPLPDDPNRPALAPAGDEPAVLGCSNFAAPASPLFAALAAVAFARPVMITIGAAAGEGRLRVNLIAQRLNASDTKAPAPLIAEGTPEELDRELAAQVTAHLAGTTPPAGVTTKTVAQPAKAAARARSSSPKKKATAKKPAKKPVAAKPAAKKSAKKKAPTVAFMKPMRPSAELAAVVGDKPIVRTEVTKLLWEYIRKQGLQDKKNRRQINADDALRPLFGGKKHVSMFEMTKLVNKHLTAEPT